MLNDFDHFLNFYKSNCYSAFKIRSLECKNDFEILNVTRYFLDVSFYLITKLPICKTNLLL